MYVFTQSYGVSYIPREKDHYDNVTVIGWYVSYTSEVVKFLNALHPDIGNAHRYCNGFYFYPADDKQFIYLAFFPYYNHEVHSSLIWNPFKISGGGPCLVIKYMPESFINSMEPIYQQICSYDMDAWVMEKNALRENPKEVYYQEQRARIADPI